MSDTKYYGAVAEFESASAIYHAAEKVVAGDGHLHQRFMTLRPERWYGWSSEQMH